MVRFVTFLKKGAKVAYISGAGCPHPNPTGGKGRNGWGLGWWRRLSNHNGRCRRPPGWATFPQKCKCTPTRSFQQDEMYIHVQAQESCQANSRGLPAGAPAGPPLGHNELLKQIQVLLTDVPVVDRRTQSVVQSYANTASQWHDIVATCVTTFSTNKETVRLGDVFRCLDKCVAQQIPTPPFLVVFQQTFCRDWARRIVSALVGFGGRQWHFSQCVKLGAELRVMCSRGLCHRQHIGLVDDAKNPSCLLDFVVCIRNIWSVPRRGDAVTPEILQCLKKLSSCSYECILLLSYYASACVNEQCTNDLVEGLFEMHRVVNLSLVRSGFVAQSVLSHCVQTVTFSRRQLRSLFKVESLLTEVWALLVNPKFDHGECILLPGIPGSHVDAFSLPATVLKNAAPDLLMHLMRSSLMLSYKNPDEHHAIEIHANAECLRGLKVGILECLESMMTASRFAGETGCALPVWDEYIELTRQVSSTRSTFGLQHTSAGTVGPAGQPNVDVVERMGSVVNTLQMKRQAFVNSKVNKVLICANIFDATVSIALQRTTDMGICLKSVSEFKVQPSPHYTKNISLAGKVFVDVFRITQELNFSTGVHLDNERKKLVFATPRMPSRRCRCSWITWTS